jgi:acyl carrier protein
MTGEIRNFIIENFYFGRDPGLKDDASFLDMGIIDSTGILELVAFLENRYGIRVDDVELIPDNLDSISNVASCLQAKLGAAASIELVKAKSLEER